LRDAATLANSRSPAAVYLDAAGHLVARDGGAVIKSEDDIAVDLGDWFQLISGTSTGGLLALYCEPPGSRAAESRGPEAGVP
jgi:hypothetical protein